MGIIKLAQMSEIGKKIEKRVIFRSFRQFLQIFEPVLPILQIMLNERTLFSCNLECCIDFVPF